MARLINSRWFFYSERLFIRYADAALQHADDLIERFPGHSVPTGFQAQGLEGVFGPYVSQT